jgi:hypothetical protein
MPYLLSYFGKHVHTTQISIQSHLEFGRNMNSSKVIIMSQPYFEKSVRMRLTFSKWELGSSPRLPKLQSSIAKVKTLCMEAFFISLESYQSVDVENGLAWAILTSLAQVMAKRKAGSQTNRFDSRPPKVGKWPYPTPMHVGGVRHAVGKNSTRGYKFALNLIPIRGLGKKLWLRKVAKVQTGTVSRLLLGSPKIKSHLDVGAAERCRE